MSLETNGVWRGGLWASTVWADGVWREGVPIIIEYPVKPENISFAGNRTNRTNSSDARQSNTSFASRRNT